MHSSSLAHCFIQLSLFYYIYFNILFCEMFPHSTHDVRLSLGPASETVEQPLRLPKEQGQKLIAGQRSTRPRLCPETARPPCIPPAYPFPSLARLRLALCLPLTKCESVAQSVAKFRQRRRL